MNGRVGSDRGVGKYTFVGSRGSSVVDYVLTSQELFNLIEDFDVQEPNIMSDHCLVNFSSKAVLLLWIFYVFVLSCVCYVLCTSVYMCFVVTC